MTALKHNGIEVKLKSILDDIVFPISKKNLIEFARNAADGDDVIDVLNGLANQMYETREEVDTEIQKILKKKEGKKHNVIENDEEV